MTLENTLTKKNSEIFLENFCEKDVESDKDYPINKNLAATTKNLFRQYGYKSYQQKLEGLSKEQLEKLYDFFTDSFLKNPKKLIILNENEGQGIVSLKEFPLISSLFSIKAFSIKDFYASQKLDHQKRREIYEKLTQWITKQCGQTSYLMTIRLAIEDNLGAEVLSQAGFYFVAGESIFLKTMKENDFPKDFHKITENIRPYREGDLEKMKCISTESHTIGRFQYDTRFQLKETQAIYTKTLEKSTEHPHHKIFIYEHLGEIAGYITVIENDSLFKKTGKKYGSLDYICVKNNQKKKGIGYALNLAGMHHLFSNHFSTLYVKTLSHNYPAIHLLTKSGFTLASSNLLYHLTER